MNERDFQLLVDLAKLTLSVQDLSRQEAATFRSSKHLKGLSKDVLDGLLNGGCSGAAASLWLAAVHREAGRHGTSNGTSNGASNGRMGR